MDGHDAVQPVLEDGAGWTVPRELAVALVAEDRYAAGPAPRRRRRQVVESPGGVARAVRPQDEGPGGVVGVDGVESQAEVVVGRHGHRPAAGQDRAHGVGRVGHLGVEHRVPLRRAQLEAAGATCRPAPSSRCRPRSAPSAPPRRSAGSARPAPPREAPASRCSAGIPARCRSTRGLGPRRPSEDRRAYRSRGRPHRPGARRPPGRARSAGRMGREAGRSRRPSAAHPARPAAFRHRPRGATGSSGRSSPATARRPARRGTRPGARPMAGSGGLGPACRHPHGRSSAPRPPGAPRRGRRRGRRG